jgi:transposase
MPQPTPRQRRQWMAWYFAHGRNVRATCAQFGIHRSTLYRWLARAAAQPQQPVRARSRRPQTTQRRTWSADELRLVCGLLGQYPTWGRRRLADALFAQTGTLWSEATVGRMRARMQPRCPVCQGHAGRHDEGGYALARDLDQLGVPGPAWPRTRTATAPDPEVAALVREAQRLLRERHA